MAKKKKKLKENKRHKGTRRANTAENNLPGAFTTWQESDGLHAIMPGERPSKEMIEEMTKEYQKQIRNSPLWKHWVTRLGKKEAEKLLKQCRAELR